MKLEGVPKKDTQLELGLEESDMPSFDPIFKEPNNKKTKPPAGRENREKPYFPNFKGTEPDRHERQLPPGDR